MCAACPTAGENPASAIWPETARHIPSWPIAHDVLFACTLVLASQKVRHGHQRVLHGQQPCVPGDARPHRSVCGEVHCLSGAVVVALQLHASAVLRRADHGQRPERGTSKVARDRALTHGALLTRFDAQRARSGAASARADAWMHALRSTSLRYQCRGWSLV